MFLKDSIKRCVFKRSLKLLKDSAALMSGGSELKTWQTCEVLTAAVKFCSYSFQDT
jgi:hypothetical protein